MSPEQIEKGRKILRIDEERRMKPVLKSLPRAGAR